MEHLLSTSGALSHPVTRAVVLVALGVLLLGLPVAWILRRAGIASQATYADVRTRHITWMVLGPAILVPVLSCAAGAIGAVLALSLLCYREFARATGLFRHRGLSALVVLGIIALALASADNWYRLFVALSPLTVVVLAGAGVLCDEPKGYIQRTALAAMAFLLFGVCLGHLGYMANDAQYRPLLCMVFVCAQGSDVFAYICGKAFGRRRLFPNTSPNKTRGGHLGALLLSAPLAAWLGHCIYPGTALDTPLALTGLGLIVGVGAQLGDLVLGSMKRDLGIKDLGSTLPGHGGFTDRCNSLLLVAPAVFHYVNHLVGIGADRPIRVLF